MSLRQEGMNMGGKTGKGKMKGTRPQYMGLVDTGITLPNGDVARHFNGTIRRAGDAQFSLPRSVRKPTTWFVNSMSDLFHENMEDKWLTDIWATMVACEHHNFQVLTKRPNPARRKIAALGLEMSPNIWLGVSICENKFAKVMVRDLLACGAAVSFVSAEPLLEALPDLDVSALDWLIAGGESGRGNLRPTNEDWVRDLRDRCADVGTPFFFKQWGHKVTTDVTGKKIVWAKGDAGHLIDGEEIWQMPATVFDRMTISNPRWTRIHKGSIQRLRNGSAAALPNQRTLMNKGEIVILDPMDEETYETKRGGIMFTDDPVTATIQRLAAADDDTVFDNPNVDHGLAEDKVDRVYRAITDVPATVATLVRATNLSHPTVARIGRMLAREGKVFEVRPLPDPKLGAAQPTFAFSRRTAAEAYAAKAKSMMAEAEAMMAKAREMMGA
jgi:protein gp37